MKKISKKLLSPILTLLSVLVLRVPFFISDYYNPSDAEVEYNTERAEKYLILDKQRVYFNYDLAKQKGEPDGVLQQGLLVETISNLYNDDNLSVKKLLAMSFPVWGNYCGPGHSGNGFKAPAIDILDKGCKAHDRCFKGMKYRQNCECNQALVNYIDDNYSSMSGWKMKSVAKAIKLYFSTAGNIGC